jgi:sarcosine oxidase subunit gamma
MEGGWMPDNVDVSATQSSPLDSAVISAGPMLVMAPVSDCTRLSLRIAKKHLSKAAEAFGLDIPENIGEMALAGKSSALCLGPDEWLLLAPEDNAEELIANFAKMSEKTIHSLVDIGHRTVGIDISGPAAAMVLNAGCPLDLDAMPVGSCTRTVMDKAEIILMKLAKKHYRVEIARSFADYVWSFLSTVGREFDISKR